MQPYFSKHSLQSLQVDVLELNIAVVWTPVVETYAVRCGSENGHQIGMCIEKIGICAQNMITILDFNNKQNWGGFVRLLNIHKNLHYADE